MAYETFKRATQIIGFAIIVPIEIITTVLLDIYVLGALPVIALLGAALVLVPLNMLFSERLGGYLQGTWVFIVAVMIAFLWARKAVGRRRDQYRNNRYTEKMSDLLS